MDPLALLGIDPDWVCLVFAFLPVLLAILSFIAFFLLSRDEGSGIAGWRDGTLNGEEGRSDCLMYFPND